MGGVRRDGEPDLAPLLSDILVFDTTIPLHLSRHNRTQMLRDCFTGRAKIPGAVEGELRGWSRAFPRVGELFAPRPFLDVVRITDRAARERIYARQRGWKGQAVVDANPRVGRGEAECLELCRQNPWHMVAQDSDAIQGAKKDKTLLYGMPDVLMAFVLRDFMLAENAWKLYELMTDDAVPDRLHCSRWYDREEVGRDKFMRRLEDNKGLRTTGTPAPKEP